jgi:hypothetical protein
VAKGKSEARVRGGCVGIVNKNECEIGRERRWLESVIGVAFCVSIKNRSNRNEKRFAKRGMSFGDGADVG